MPAIHSLNVNFNGGELSPLMNGRVDFDGYRSGCVQMENFMVRPYGGAFKVPGTQYIGEVKDSTKKVRLVSMRISRTENYILEVGAGYFRFWKETEPAYLQINSGYSVVAHSTATTYELGDLCSSGGTNYVRCGNGGATDSSFATALAAGYWHALTGSIIEWPNSFSESELAEIDWHPVNRTLVMTHANHSPLIIESVPTDGADDFIDHVAWSDATTTTPSYSFMVGAINFTFPPLVDHPLSATSGQTVTVAYQAAAWATATVYAVGNLRKNTAGTLVYYCTTAHTSAAATEPGVGASWATRWRLATPDEVLYTLTASTADIFDGLGVGDLFIVESQAEARTATMAGTPPVSYETLPTFMQGSYAVSTEWVSGGAPLCELQLQESKNGVTWHTINAWTVASLNAGTILYNDEAPAQGAWYRLNGQLNSATSGNCFGKLEPRFTPAKLPFRISSVTSSTVLVVSSALPYGGIVPSAMLGSCEFFFLPAFSASNGYPSCVGFHNLRLWFGGTSKEPNRVRGSNVDDFFNFATGDKDDNGFDVVLNSSASNLVRWIAGYRQGLVVGTEGDEWTIQGGGDGSEVLKPTNIQAIQRNRSGSKRLSAIQTKDSLLWVSLTGRRVHEFSYVFASDNYEAPDMTLRAEHVTEGGIIDAAFQNEPDPILWCVSGNGVLLGFSYNRQNQITAWFRRTTDGYFEAVATLRSTGDADRVWCVVKRTINGATKRYIERFYPTAQEFNFSTASDFCYLDCAKKITQASSTAVSGLSHLEAKAVKVWHSGTTIESKTVASGAITLSSAATTMFVGLPIASVLQPEPIEQVLQDGTAQGRRFNAQRIQLLLHKAMGGSLSNDPALTGDSIGYPSGSGVFTGRVDEHVPAEWLDALTLTFKHSDPTPFNLLGFVLKAEIYGQ